MSASPILFYLWLSLSALCLANAIRYTPTTEKRQWYLVVYSTSTGDHGNTCLEIREPLSSQRITDIRDFIANDAKRPDWKGNLIIESMVKISP